MGAEHRLQKVYNRIPFYVAAPAYFLYRYIVQLGFLDGVPGAVYHFLQGCWYRFLVGAKVVELEAGLRGIDDQQLRLETLSRLTGHRLQD